MDDKDKPPRKAQRFGWEWKRDALIASPFTSAMRALYQFMNSEMLRLMLR
jgi:hypothetical protein